MLNRSISTMFVLATFLFFATACSSTTSNDVNTDDSKSGEESSNTEEAILPDDQLQKGDEGEPVHHLQKIIQKIDYPVKSTGKFDKETTWAITDLQLQQDDLEATGIYDKDTMEIIEKILEEKLDIEPGSALNQPEEETNADGSAIVDNPYEILSLVNKQNALPDGYIPEDLVVPNVRFPFTEDLPKKQMRKVAADALTDMFEAGDEDGVDLFAQSGYRSFDRQEAIFASYSEENGEEAANNFSARPGESEHQTGLTMDITSPDINYELNTDFGKTDEGKWVKEHAAEFGFIIRYPEDKEDITEYQYEPWHLRYVGKRAAKEIVDNNLSLEEYIQAIVE